MYAFIIWVLVIQTKAEFQPMFRITMA